MYIKRTRKWRSSREITYLSLAHGIWEERPDGQKQTRPLILMSLGPEDEADPIYLKDLVASAQAMFDRRVADGMGAVEAAQDVARSFQPHLGQVRVLANRKLGMRLLLTPIWESLGIKEAFGAFAQEHRIRAFDFERLIFRLVLNRIIDPKSKRAANEWLQEDAYYPEAEDWEAQHYYRALDVLHENWVQLEEMLFRTLWNLSDEELRKLLRPSTRSKIAALRYTDLRPWKSIHVNVMYLLALGGQQGRRYEFTAIDARTREAVAAIYPSKPLRIQSTIRAVVTDNGQEFVSGLFRQVYSILEIMHKRTRLHRHPSTGKAKRGLPAPPVHLPAGPKGAKPTTWSTTRQNDYCRMQA